MHKILIIGPSWVGDTMLMQPMLMRLKQRHPDSLIDVLAPPWTAELLHAMPEVHEVVTNPFAHGALELNKRYQLGKQLRDARYDQAIVLPNSLKSALRAVFCAHPAAHRLHRRGAIRPAQRCARAEQDQAAVDGGTFCATRRTGRRRNSASFAQSQTDRYRQHSAVPRCASWD